MKKIVLSLALAALTLAAVAQGNHQRDGYVTKNGTYVAPSYATNPDNSRLNNYSTQGNVNPYTGNAGTVNPYQSTVPVPRQQHCFVQASGRYTCQ